MNVINAAGIACGFISGILIIQGYDGIRKEKRR